MADGSDNASAVSKAMSQAGHRLARRAHSRAELGEKLSRLGHTQAVVERVLGRLAEMGYVDDEAFGRGLIRQVCTRRPAGPRLLRQKLRQKGLDAALTERLIGEAMDEGSQRDEAAALVQRRLAGMAGLDARTRRRRLMGLLGRRGFEREAIDYALEACRDRIDEAG